MRFVSIDPSLRNTAIVWGEIEDGEVIKPKSKLVSSKKDKKLSVASDTVNSCRNVIQALNEVLEDFKPDVTFAETPSGSQNASSAKGYGVSCAFISILEPNLVIVTPFEIKKVVSGKNTASKLEIMNWVHKKHRKFLPLKKDGSFNLGKAEHIADALAAVYAGMLKDEFKNITNG